MYGAMIRPATSSITRVQKLDMNTIAQATQGFERRIAAFYWRAGNDANS